MNSEHKDMKQNADSEADSFEIDPLAEHEEQPGSTLNWPDRKPEASEQQLDSATGDRDDTVTQEGDASEYDLSDFEPDESEPVSSNPSAATTNQEGKEIDNNEQTDWLSELDVDSEQLTTPAVEGKPKRRSLFGRKAREAKEAPIKTDPDMGVETETDTNSNIDTGISTDIANHLVGTSGNDVGKNADVNDENNGDIKTRQFQPRKVAYGVAKAVGVGLVGTLIVILYRDVSSLKQNQNTRVLELREQILSEMNSLEKRVVSASGDLRSSLESISEQVDTMKSAAQVRDGKLEDLIEGGDNELAIEAIKEMVNVDRAIISKLDASIEKLEEKIVSLESKGTNITITKKIPTKRAAPKAATPKTVSSVEGYSLFSVDLWGNTPLLVLIKGTEIKRIKEGASFMGWQVSGIDSYKKRATLRKGKCN